MRPGVCARINSRAQFLASLLLLESPAGRSFAIPDLVLRLGFEIAGAMAPSAGQTANKRRNLVPRFAGDDELTVLDLVRL